MGLGLTRRRAHHRRRVPLGTMSLAIATVALAGLHGASAAPRPSACRGDAPTTVRVQASVTVGTIPDGESVLFTYSIEGGGGVVGQVQLTLTSTVASASGTVGGLAPGIYLVREVSSGSFPPAPDQSATVAPPACAPLVSFVHAG